MIYQVQFSDGEIIACSPHLIDALARGRQAGEGAELWALPDSPRESAKHKATFTGGKWVDIVYA